jgi:hypothetical protein
MVWGLPDYKSFAQRLGDVLPGFNQGRKGAKGAQIIERCPGSQGFSEVKEIAA